MPFDTTEAQPDTTVLIELQDLSFKVCASGLKTSAFTSSYKVWEAATLFSKLDTLPRVAGFLSHDFDSSFPALFFLSETSLSKFSINLDTINLFKILF